MKRLFAVLVFLMPGILFAALPGELVLPDFRGLEARASDSVNISIDPWLLNLMGVVMNGSDADAADTRRIMKGIKSIQIRSFEFDKEFAYPAAEIEGVRRQFQAPGWNRLLQTHNAANSEKVDIYLLSEDQQPRGFALVCSEPKSFTIINIVGSVNVQDLAKLQSRLDLSRLRASAVL
jgi:hypothetical protein